MAEIITFDRGRKVIDDAILILLNRVESKNFEDKTKMMEGDQYMNVYTTVHTMCTQKMPHYYAVELYELHKSTIKQYLLEKALPALRETPDNDLLGEVTTCWKKFSFVNKWMGKFFLHLDRHYVPVNDLPSLKDSGIHLFKAEVFDKISPQATRIILLSLENGRTGEESDFAILQECLEMYKAVDPDNRQVNAGTMADILPAKTSVSKDIFATARSVYEEAVLDGGVAPWNRAKLMIVGEGHSGKSSTVSSFLGKKFNPNMQSTVGAETASSCSVSKKDYVNWAERKEHEDEFAPMAARATARKIRNVRQAPVSASMVADPNVAALSINDKKIAAGANVQPASATVQEKTEFVKQFDEHFDEQMFSDALAETDDPSKRKVTLSIWDYGGQQVFYTLHHLFLTQYGVYLVVFDMSRIIDEGTRAKAMEMLCFWIRSILVHAEEAPIFFLGTHKDKVNQPEQWKLIDELLMSELKIYNIESVETNRRQGLWFFPIDNTIGREDETIRELQETILTVIKTKDYVQMEVPIAWIRVLDVLLKQRKVDKFLTFSQVVAVAADAAVLESQVETMLVFFNQLGVILFFDFSPQLRELVILEPQWLIDALTKVIREFDLHRYDMLHEKELRSSSFKKDFDKLQKRAIVSERLLFCLWSNETPERRAFLLDLMKWAILACDWSLEPLDGQTGAQPTGREYLIPSLFSIGKNVESMPDRSQNLEKVEAEFALNFQEGFLPHGVFPRLVALAATLATEKFEDSRTPVVSETKALMSFGEADFCMEYCAKVDLIRVSVVHAQSAWLVCSSLMPLFERLNEEVMHGKLKMEVDLVLSDLSTVKLEKAVKARVEGKTSVRDENSNSVPLSKLDMFFENKAAVPNKANSTAVVPPTKKSRDLPAFDYDFFLSHRVNTESKLADWFFQRVSRANRKSFLDAQELKLGQDWRDGFVEALVRSKHIVFFMSWYDNDRTGSIGQMTKFHQGDYCDNVLLEILIAFYLLKEGRSKSFTPIFAGPVDAATDHYEDFPFSKIGTLPDVVSTFTLKALDENMNKVGLPVAPTHPVRLLTIKTAVEEITKYQGIKLSDLGKVLVAQETAAKKLLIMLDD